MEESEDAKRIRSVVQEGFQVKTMENIAPIQTPVTYYTSWLLHHHGSRCEWFERNWLECASQMGRYGSNKNCRDEDDDFKECVLGQKAFKRYMRMQEERQKNRVPYLNPPPLDTLQNYKYKQNIFE